MFLVGTSINQGREPSALLVSKSLPSKVEKEVVGKIKPRFFSDLLKKVDRKKGQTPLRGMESDSSYAIYSFGRPLDYSTYYFEPCQR